MTKTLAAVVVTYNRLDHLRHTIDRLLSEPIDYVVVVNNASTDGTQAYLESLSEPRLSVMNLTENTGGAGGFEAGLKEAVKRHDPDWFVVMDDDAYPREGAITVFRDGSYDDVDMVAASVFLKSGGIAEMNRPWVNPFRGVGAFFRTLLRGRAGYHIKDQAYSSAKATMVDGASFVGLFLSRKTLKDFGFPDGRLFIYGDDVLYTLQASKQGTGVRFDPAIAFEHDCQTGSTDGVFTPLWKNYYRFRNQIFVYRLAAGPFFAIPVIFVQLTRWRLWSRNLPLAEREAYRRILRTAVGDAKNRNLDRSHEEVLALSQS